MAVKTRKFAISLEIQLEAPTPEAAAELFVQRIRSERRGFELEILEDRGEDTWVSLGRKRVEVDGA